MPRTSFIALDKQDKYIQEASRKKATPENKPRLFDLIKVTDKRVLPAFFFALRDTLVAEDLAEATRIAFMGARHRVVTMRGDLIEVSGEWV